ncbi:MAG: hypothetical protein IJC15_05425, partial [Clostridia bacterium]|nr:hypothetical protein [Clostridia bacterium]
MRPMRLLCGFGGVCAGLWTVRQAAPLWETAQAWCRAAVTHSGSRILVRLFGLTFAFDGGLLQLIGEKWRALLDAGSLLLPPGAADMLGCIGEAMTEALRRLL